MTGPDYGAMARGVADLGLATVRVEARMFERWARLVGRCGSRLAEGAEGGDAGGFVSAAGDAARDYARGLAGLPELAMLDLAAEVDAVRRGRKDRAGSGGAA